MLDRAEYVGIKKPFDLSGSCLLTDKGTVYDIEFKVA